MDRPWIGDLAGFAPVSEADWREAVGEGLEDLRRQTADGARKELCGLEPVVVPVPGMPAGWTIGSLHPGVEGTELVVESAPDLDLAPYHQAGANAVQELAWMVAQLLPQADRASELTVGFEVGRDVFEEAAKLRAARVLWHKTLLAAGQEPTRPKELRATTAWRTLTEREPMTNVLRATTQAFAAAIGGADVIVVRPHEDTEEGQRLAVHLQHVLREEAHLGRTADPLAGSYSVERRTDELARAAWDEARAIFDRGGFDSKAAGEASGKAWEALELKVLGVNLHPLEGAPVGDLGAAPVAPFAIRREEDRVS